LFQIGFIEILFIGLIILLLFGPERLPEISKIIIKNRGIISSGENKKPLLKLSFFCKNPLLFNKEILLNIN